LGGGSPNGLDNAKLSDVQRGAIGARIRECYTQDTAAKDYQQQWALIRVTTDADGLVRMTDIIRNSPGFVGRAFAERAARAARDPQCAKLPLPKQMLGSNHTFEITFKP
jgi:neural Wiskott-Aldrich syndrome protein